MARLGPAQQAVFQAMADSSASPIDRDHLKIGTRNGEALLEFCYNARSALEFDVFAEFFEDSFTICCDGWHDEFVMEQDTTENGRNVLEKLKFVFEGKVKLRVTYAGRSAHKWQLLFDEAIDWHVMRLTGLLFYNYFGRRKTVQKVNKIIG